MFGNQTYTIRKGLISIGRAAPELPNFDKAEQVGQCRFRTCILVGPIGMQSIPTAAGHRINQRASKIVLAQKPSEREGCTCRPFRAGIQTRCSAARRDRRPCFDRLLIVCGGLLPVLSETGAADGSEVSVEVGLNVHQPSKRANTRIDVVLPAGGDPGLD